MGPQTRGIISNMAEHDGSSKQSCRARMQFNMATTPLMVEPERKQYKEIRSS